MQVRVVGLRPNRSDVTRFFRISDRSPVGIKELVVASMRLVVTMFFERLKQVHRQLQRLAFCWWLGDTRPAHR